MNDKKRKPYINWADEELYNTGKYASQNKIAVAIRHYQSKYKNLNGSRVRGLKNRVKNELKIATKNKNDLREKLPVQVQERPLALCDHIKQVGKRGGVIKKI